MSSNPLVDLLGEELKSGASTVPTAEAVAGKIVGLYFSAHWCPPCRGFTPALAKSYNDLVAAGKPFEIIFVSSDRDEGSFNEYFGEMPWKALPFDDRDRKASLSKKFRVQGIPTLVILDEDGKTITTDGRRCISEDPAGKDFPWRPKSTEELLGDVLDGKNGKVPVSSLKGKKIALYFSAHWCPPCRGFTPQLAEVYNNMKSSGKDDFEFIFVSSDRDEESFNEYFGEMPWLALPFANREEKQLLSAKYEVSGIPSLITLDENFKVINKSARGQAGADTKGENFPWYPAPVEELSATVESNGFDVNEKPALIAGLVGMGSAEQNEVEQDMIKVAKEYIAAADDEGPEFIFFTAKNSAGPVDQVFKMMDASSSESPVLVMLDIPDDGGFYMKKVDKITSSEVTQFISDYKAKNLDRQQLS